MRRRKVVGTRPEKPPATSATHVAGRSVPGPAIFESCLSPSPPSSPPSPHPPLCLRRCRPRTIWSVLRCVLPRLCVPAASSSNRHASPPPILAPRPPRRRPRTRLLLPRSMQDRLLSRARSSWVPLATSLPTFSVVRALAFTCGSHQLTDTLCPFPHRVHACRFTNVPPVTSSPVAYRQPIVYNFTVAREFLKHIYVAERLQPPSLSTVQSAYGTIWSRASSPAYWKEIFRTGEYAKLGIYAVEAYGIFKVSNTFISPPLYPESSVFAVHC